MAQGTPYSQVPLIDDKTVKNTYADGCVGINVTSGNVYVTFASVATDYGQNVDPAPQHRLVSARLVMPIPGAVALRDLLTQMIERLVADGALVQRTGAAAD